eukprot:67501-Chlamydomonas_euryale.AAC.2
MTCKDCLRFCKSRPRHSHPRMRHHPCGCPCACSCRCTCSSPTLPASPSPKQKALVEVAKRAPIAGHPGDRLASGEDEVGRLSAAVCATGAHGGARSLHSTLLGGPTSLCGGGAQRSHHRLRVFAGPHTVNLPHRYHTSRRSRRKPPDGLARQQTCLSCALHRREALCSLVDAAAGDGLVYHRHLKNERQSLCQLEDTRFITPRMGAGWCGIWSGRP